MLGKRRSVAPVEFLKRLQRDVRSRDRPVSRSELPFLLGASVAVIVAAQLNEPGTLGDLVLLIVAGLVSVARSLAPRVPAEVFTVGILGPTALAIGHQGHLEVAYFLVVTMTLYAAWHLGSTLRAVIIAAVSSTVIIVIAGVRPDAYSWEPWVAAEIFTLVLGRTLYRQQRLIGDLEAAREALAAQAVFEERRRIARELHDLAGHTLAAMLLHVTGARHVLRRDLDEADRALRDAEAVGRTSLDQIRVTVAALRTTEGSVDPPLAEAGGLEELVTEYRRAGLRIDADIADSVSGQCGATAIALHRIAREALANVARHNPTNRVKLQAAENQHTGRIELSVTDHGRTVPKRGPSAGFGLVGMRERARALGGIVSAEPTHDGWQVHASLPPAETTIDEVSGR